MICELNLSPISSDYLNVVQYVVPLLFNQQSYPWFQNLTHITLSH